MHDVRRALADPHPLGLLALASSLLAAVDPRERNPFARRDEEVLSLDELVASLVSVERRETSALLAALAEMVPDDILRAGLRRRLAERRDRRPPWLDQLGRMVPYRMIEMVHVLRDGDNVMIGVRLPEGHQLSVVVYIDHNLGTVVKDAFVVPGPLTELVDLMRAEADDPDTSWADLDPAEARARITDAIATGAMTYPPFETDSWPMCRPLVEWVVRRLPEGGVGYQRPVWDESDLDALAERFFASSPGAPFDDLDHRRLLDSILWFGSGYGPGDPLRWSAVAVELILLDWIPRKLVEPVPYLARGPALLKAFIRFCHAERGIREALTIETLEAVDRCEAEYQEIIRSPRPQGPEALLAAVGALDRDGPWAMPDDGRSFAELALAWLDRAVGGREALVGLDTTPLPDEPFAWDGLAPDIHGRVDEVLELVDAACDDLLDVEYRTACRRFLARVAARDPATFRRQARADRTAAAVVWSIGRGNDAFSGRDRRLMVKDLMAHFGLSGTPSGRASTLLQAGGFIQAEYGALDLGSTALLVAPFRAHLIELRDRYLAMDG